MNEAEILAERDDNARDIEYCRRNLDEACQAVAEQMERSTLAYGPDRYRDWPANSHMALVDLEEVAASCGIRLTRALAYRDELHAR